MLTPAVFEDMAVMKQAASKLYFGQVRASRELSQVLLDTASREKRNQAIADLERNIALDEALVGRIERARQNANASLRLGGEPGMALALIGDAAHASKIAEKWTSQTSKGDDANGIWVPELRATVELKRGNAMRAVELLVPMERYEAGWVDSYMAAYLRGQAYLAAQRGDEAASEFQKILVHRGVVLSSLIGPLSFVGLARAYTLQRDAPKARAAYQDFLTLWKDADPDIPIYKQAKAEYPRLR